jgi:hypothetical protein
VTVGTAPPYVIVGLEAVMVNGTGDTVTEPAT